MKKTFIFLTFILFSYVPLVFGEVIRLTNNNYLDDHPMVNAEGHVWWFQWRGASIDGYLMYYNGSEVIEAAHLVNTTLVANWGGSAMDRNFVVYVNDVNLDHNNEIYLFDGKNNFQISNDNSFSGYEPTICNGFIAWTGMTVLPDENPDENSKEIFLYKPDQPTAVNMSTLKATPSNKQVKVEWQTESEIDNAGFNVWRAEGFQKVNESIIPAEGSPIMGTD
jgi:hypothetical protein